MGSDAGTQCAIPVAALRAAPYSIDWGSSVFAKVTAINIYGSSAESPEGNGATIITATDPPTGLSEIEAERTSSSVTFSWTPPVFIGGAPVVDYRVKMAVMGQTPVVIASGVTETSY